MAGALLQFWSLMIDLEFIKTNQQKNREMYSTLPAILYQLTCLLVMLCLLACDHDNVLKFDLTANFIFAVSLNLKIQI